jgi:hypothetical protein
MARLLKIQLQAGSFNPLTDQSIAAAILKMTMQFRAWLIISLQNVADNCSAFSGETAFHGKFS